MDNIDTILIMGHTCVGKSIVAKKLSEENGAYCYNMDDLKFFLQAIITDKMDKSLANALNYSSFLEKKSIETLIKESISISKLFSHGIEPIIAHNLYTKTKLILEGSYILPYLGAKKTIANQSIQTKNIKSILIFEPDDKFIIQNIINRDKQRGCKIGFEYQNKTKQNILFELIIREKKYLLEEAKKYNIKIIESRPFDTLFDRVKRVLIE
jgi:2-phosphoglycerate kinase